MGMERFAFSAGMLYNNLLINRNNINKYKLIKNISFFVVLLSDFWYDTLV